MCVSTAYQNDVLPESILMKNVRAFRVVGKTIVLTNILEQQMTITGTLMSADLINGVVVISCEA